MSKYVLLCCNTYVQVLRADHSSHCPLLGLAGTHSTHSTIQVTRHNDTYCISYISVKKSKIVVI